jgi:hypothetical protein
VFSASQTAKISMELKVTEHLLVSRSSSGREPCDYFSALIRSLFGLQLNHEPDVATLLDQTCA